MSPLGRITRNGLALVTPFAAFGAAAGLTWTLHGPDALAIALATLAGIWVGVLAAGVATFLTGPRGGHSDYAADLPRVPDPGRWAPPRNPDRPAAGYESYTIPPRNLNSWE